MAYCLLAGMPVHSARAQSGRTGTIEGRFFNPRSGDDLENARIAIEGIPTLETFTDSNGQYRLNDVPAGSVKVRAFYTVNPVNKRFGIKAKFQPGNWIIGKETRLEAMRTPCYFPR